MITGKFCLLFEPVSVSQSSFSVTPSKPRSIPFWPLAKIEFPRMATPVEVSLRKTPKPVAKAIVLPSPGFVPPIRLLELAPTSTKMPFSPLVSRTVPVTSVPILFPWTTLLLAPPLLMMMAVPM